MIQITDITRGYSSTADRTRAIHALRRRGWTYFVPYHDTHARFALCYGMDDTQPRVSPKRVIRPSTSSK